MDYTITYYLHNSNNLFIIYLLNSSFSSFKCSFLKTYRSVAVITQKMKRLHSIWHWIYKNHFSFKKCFNTASTLLMNTFISIWIITQLVFFLPCITLEGNCLSNTLKCTNSPTFFCHLILFHLLYFYLKYPWDFKIKMLTMHACKHLHVHGSLTLVMITWHAGKQIKYFIFSVSVLFWFILKWFVLIKKKNMI